MEVLHLDAALINDYLTIGARYGRRPLMDGAKLRATGATRLQMRRLDGGIVTVEATRGNGPRAIVSLMDGNRSLLRVHLRILLLGEADGVASAMIARAHHLRPIAVPVALVIGVLGGHQIFSL